MTTRPVETGKVIAGRYRLDHQLGQGGMGSVWSAQHLELRSKVAVKLIVPQHAADPATLARFVREARAAAALRSPHVVQILDYGVDEGLAFIVMEQLQGEDLAARLGREGRLSPALTGTIITHVARAIQRAHDADLVHRDLKPANIFLVQNDDEIVAKVLDFGLAKARPGAEDLAGARTDTGTVLGSPFYMSPEQALARHDIDWRSDLWSMGVVAFECLVGQRPFRGNSIGDVIMMICSDPLPVPSTLADVPPGLDAWFARAAERDVLRRFQSAKELATSLRATLAPQSAAGAFAPDLDPRDSDEPKTLPETDGPLQRPTGARSGELHGATTTAATAGDPRRPSQRTESSPGSRRLKVALLSVTLLAATLAWLVWTRSPTDESTPTREAASPSAAALPPVSASSELITAPAVAPVFSVGSSASLPAIAPSASGTKAAAERISGSAASGLRPVRIKPTRAVETPKENPLDQRF